MVSDGCCKRESRRFKEEKMDSVKKIVYHQWFDIIIMSIGLMWLAPWGSFDVKSVGFYISIIVSILSVKTTRFLLKKYQKDYMGKIK
jgi:membrane protein implicated in regulation of membrane protease activity